MATQREQVSDEQIDRAFDVLKEAVKNRIRRHGRGKWVSPHEGLGITVEEVHELTVAIHANDRKSTVEENLDVAVCGLWGYISLS